MTDSPLFRGVATALITPLTETGIDVPRFKKLIDWQIESGINGLVIAGTTGEASTLTDEEHRDAVRIAVEHVAGRVPVIAGTGSNDTAYAIDLTRYCCEVGADGVLVVTPYYNKATQKGLIRMFTEIADASTVPVVLYNVPGRTNVNIEPETYRELAKHPRITAIKEANGDISKVVATVAAVGDALDLYSGNDDQIVPLMSMGGQGVISVLSNVAPKETVAMCQAFFDGDVAGAAREQARLLPLIQALFAEVNPIPVKAAMADLGWCSDEIRLPLTVIEPEHREALRERMAELGLDTANHASEGAL